MQTKDILETFQVWATSDAHVVREALAEGFDPARVPRESMRIAIEQAEGPHGFHYDLGFHLGDLLDYDHETAENFQKYRQQLACSSKDPHGWYHLEGNNEENSVLNDKVSIDNEYYRNHIDPVGEFTETSGIDNRRRPFPVEGTYERYSFDVGNIRFLFLSDRNDLPAPYGRGEGGFYVDGAITLESFQWLVRQVITFPERILVVACHHPLKNTTIGTGLDDSWRGKYMTQYNPKKVDDPTQRLQGTLHQVYPIHKFDTPLFHQLLGQNEGAVDLWLSGHVHHRLGETFEGRGKYAFAYGGHHLNVGTICRYRHFANIISAQSNLFSWKVGAKQVQSQVYVHDHPEFPCGFYKPEERRLELKRPFCREAEPVVVRVPETHVSKLRLDKTDSDHVRLCWEGDSTGLLLLQSPSANLRFRPSDEKVYYAGEKVPDGEVVFIGTSREVAGLPVSTSGPVFLHAFAYNAGGGRIRYYSGPVQPEPPMA